MNKTISSLTGLLLLAALPAAAQQKQAARRFQLQLPAGVHLSATDALKISRIFQSHASPLAQKKGAAGNEKLRARATYEFRSPAGNLLDSTTYTYGASRGSEYDFSTLTYNLENSTDYPYADGFSGSGFVRFDTARSYGSATPGTPTIMALRTYNASDKVLTNEYPNTPSITYFQYNASGKVARVTTLDGSAGMGLDSFSRNFYIYDANGFVVRDSSEQYDAGSGTWSPSVTIVLTNNSVGLSTKQAIQFPTPFGNITFAELNTLYNTGNQPIRNIIQVMSTFSGPLENVRKDTFAYTSGMLTKHLGYSWDTVAKSWRLADEDYRRLNAASLPDSVWQGVIEDGTGIGDTTIQKLSYNTAGNPTFQRSFEKDGRTKSSEERYYYTSAAVSVPKTTKLDISVYPNPSSTQIRITGSVKGRFSITNVAGQLMMTGAVLEGTIIPVANLSAGIYQLTITDAAGTLHAARFVKD